MGIAILFAVSALAALGFAQIAAIVLSARLCRAVPLFWILAVVAAVAGPFVLTAPVPVKHGSGAEALIGYLFVSAFNRFNAVCFVGAVVSAIVALLPLGRWRIVSAAGWGFASAFAVQAIRLLTA